MSYKPDYKYIPPISWSILTPLYDFFCSLGGFGSRFRSKVLHSVSLNNDMTVADIGCGTGVFLKTAKQKYPRVKFIGFDPDKQALAIAERRFAKADIEVGLKESFAESLPLADQSVDVCFSTLAFHHMPDSIKQKAAKEIFRILKPSGKVVIADFGIPSSQLTASLLRLFENVEYLDGNLKGLIPRYLEEAGFSELQTVARHYPGISIISGVKK